MKIVIARAHRTPVAPFLGDFKDVSAVSLAETTTRKVLEGLPLDEIDDLILGSVLQAGQGMNPARQVALASGLPISVPGQTVNRVCGSGMQAIISAIQAIRAGDGKLYLAGGTESMSQAPFLITEMRTGRKFGNATLTDSMLHDGLTDPIHHFHMGITAENVAERYGISREEQDEFALRSHQLAFATQLEGGFKAEIIPVEVESRKSSVIIDSDSAIRPDASQEALARLKPSFKQGGTVTAGNASGLNDGAAMLTICSAECADAHGLERLAQIESYAVAGVEPDVMGLGPVPAIQLALKRAGITIGEIDRFEINEAFASQSIAVVRELGLRIDRVNPNGGAIALGHPIGASGARIVVTLVHAMRAHGQQLGVASLCIGGGMGIAMVLRNEAQ